MIIIPGFTTDPAYNLAAEEYYFKNPDIKEDIVMLWRNAPSVIIGKNQNPYKEINSKFVRANNIKVIRRITGGGAVYHDLGNINFTFISDYNEGDFGDYGRFVSPIINYLKTLGVTATLSGRNDILIDQKKISGNAQAVYKNRILHHGTLLYSSSGDNISASLTPEESKIKSHGVASVSSRVTNISNHIQSPMETEVFMKNLEDYFISAGAKIYLPTLADKENIKTLYQNRYSLFEWNFGSCGEYEFSKSNRFSCGGVTVSINVEKGIITETNITGDFFGTKPVSELEEAIVGANHCWESVLERVLKIPVEDYVYGITAEELVSLIV